MICCSSRSLQMCAALTRCEWMRWPFRFVLPFAAAKNPILFFPKRFVMESSCGCISSTLTGVSTLLTWLQYGDHEHDRCPWLSSSNRKNVQYHVTMLYACLEAPYIPAQTRPLSSTRRATRPLKPIRLANSCCMCCMQSYIFLSPNLKGVLQQ